MNLKSIAGFTIILIGATVFFSCKKHRLIDEKEILEGNWEWVYSIKKGSAITPPFNTWEDTILPSDVSSTFGIKFFKKGKVQLLENDQQKAEYRVVFNRFESGNTCLTSMNPHNFEIDLDNKWDQSLDGCVNADTLVLIYYPNFPFPKEDHGSSVVRYIDFFKKIN
jgi:hypothetical protein